MFVMLLILWVYLNPSKLGNMAWPPRDSNLRHLECWLSALPTELSRSARVTIANIVGSISAMESYQGLSWKPKFGCPNIKFRLSINFTPNLLDGYMSRQRNI